jgi:hypothetical protein
VEHLLVDLWQQHVGDFALSRYILKPRTNIYSPKSPKTQILGLKYVWLVVDGDRAARVR